MNVREILNKARDKMNIDEKKVEEAVDKAIDKAAEKVVEKVTDEVVHEKAKGIVMRFWGWVKSKVGLK